MQLHSQACKTEHHKSMIKSIWHVIYDFWFSHIAWEKRFKREENATLIQYMMGTFNAQTPAVGLKSGLRYLAFFMSTFSSILFFVFHWKQEHDK